MMSVGILCTFTLYLRLLYSLFHLLAKNIYLQKTYYRYSFELFMILIASALGKIHKKNSCGKPAGVNGLKLGQDYEFASISALNSSVEMTRANASPQRSNSILFHVSGSAPAWGYVLMQSASATTL